MAAVPEGNLHADRTRAGRSCKALGIAALALIVVSFCATAGLLRVALDYFRAGEAIRLDPAGLRVYATERGRAPAGPPLLVFFGDSRALMWVQPEPTNFRMINRGIGFQTTAQLLLRLDAHVTSL